MPLLLQKTTILYTALSLTRGFKNKPWCVFVLGGKCVYNGNRHTSSKHGKFLVIGHTWTIT